MVEKGRITVNEVDIIEVESDPSVSPGIAASIGSLAIENADDVWQKYGVLDTEWAPISRDIKSGVILAASFTQQGSLNLRKATVTFNKSLSSVNYSVSIKAKSDLRVFTIESQTITGFTVSSNARRALTGDVLWSIVEHGETA